MKRIINTVYGVLIGAVLLLLIALQGVKLVGLTPYAVTSGSMIPLYPVGCMIYVQEVDPSSVQVGDSITFYMPGSTVVATHQVHQIDQSKQLFYTQGIDNRDSEGNIIKDSDPVSFDDLIGKPIAAIPWLGTIGTICSKPPWMYIVIGCVITLCVILFSIEHITERKTQDEKH